MKHCVFLFCFLFSSAHIFSQISVPDFQLIVIKKHGVNRVRTGNFVTTLVEPPKKKIDPRNPGASAHLTLLVKDTFYIKGNSDSTEQLLKTPGSFVYIYQNTDMLDTSKYLTLIQDSTTAERFLNRVKKVRKREWELVRIVIQPRYVNRTKGIYYVMYLRFQQDLLSVNLPNKNNRENLKMKSISPSIPLIHLGSIDSSHYQVGPGISFNIGLAPRRPLMRLASDLVGPVSIEWMFYPIHNIHDVLAVRSTAIGVFFNSAYGVFHWGIAWYTLTYSRGEAYIGINIVPLLQIWNSRGKQRYRW